MLLSNYDEAAQVFGEVRRRYPRRDGDFQTTIEQHEDLIVALTILESVAVRLRQALGQEPR